MFQKWMNPQKPNFWNYTLSQPQIGNAQSLRRLVRSVLLWTTFSNKSRKLRKARISPSKVGIFTFSNLGSELVVAHRKDWSRMLGINDSRACSVDSCLWKLLTFAWNVVSFRTANFETEFSNFFQKLVIRRHNY